MFFPTPATRSALAGLLLLTAVALPRLAASGFAIAEQSVSGLGAGFAGAAAIAEDSSTVWHNPAGMLSLPASEAQLGLHLIIPRAAFTNTGTLSLDPLNARYVPTNGGNSASDTEAVVPNLYAVYQASPKLAYGLGVNAPFGLKTDYTPGWAGRYVALESSLETINANASVAWRLNDQVTVAGGLNFTQADAVLSNAVDFGLVFLSQLAPAGPINPALVPPRPARRHHRATRHGRLRRGLVSVGRRLRVGLEPRPAVGAVRGDPRRPTLPFAGRPDPAGHR